MTEPVIFKRGTTFRAGLDIGPVQTSGGPVADLTGWTGQSQARQRGGALVADLTFAWADATLGLAVLTGPATDDWPLGTVDIDVFLTAPSGDRAPSRTFSLLVIQGPTHV